MYHSSLGKDQIRIHTYKSCSIYFTLSYQKKKKFTLTIYLWVIPIGNGVGAVHHLSRLFGNPIVQIDFISVMNGSDATQWRWDLDHCELFITETKSEQIAKRTTRMIHMQHDVVHPCTAPSSFSYPYTSRVEQFYIYFCSEFLLFS